MNRGLTSKNFLKVVLLVCGRGCRSVRRGALHRGLGAVLSTGQNGATKPDFDQNEFTGTSSTI
jgi:hypothetical protein